MDKKYLKTYEAVMGWRNIHATGFMLWSTEVEDEDFILECWPTKDCPMILQIRPDGLGFTVFSIKNTIMS